MTAGNRLGPGGYRHQRPGPARLTLVVLKSVASSPHPDVDLDAFAEDLATVINRSDPHDSGAESLFGLIMRYVLLVGDAPPEHYEALFTRLGPTAREAYMSTTYDQIIQRGRGEGLQQGVQQGLQ